MKIDFLLIGAQKCATSWMFVCLKEHPEICMPRKKKEVEYLGGKLFKENGLEWFGSLFDGDCSGKKCGDASVEYIYDDECVAAVKRYAPDAKFVLLLREPIERAVSAYYWLHRKGIIHDDLESALEKSLLAIDEGKERGDPYASLIYRGFYDYQLNNWLKIFSAQNLLIIPYDAVKNDPRNVLELTYTFIGVNPKFVPLATKTKPKKNTYNSFFIGLERSLRKSTVMAKLLDKGNQFYSRVSKEHEVPELSDALRERLSIRFHSSTKALIDSIDQLPDESVIERDVFCQWLHD